MKIGVLHPGLMGQSIASTLGASGHEVFWLSEGRSAETRARANEWVERSTLPGLIESVDHLISVCPPDRALDLATLVSSSGFEGIYVDANAISPGTARTIASQFGRNFVDGGIIGPATTRLGTTRLYLSGDRSEEVVDWFREGPIAALGIGAETSRASALKMCYAAQTKGSAALLLGVCALAESEGVSDLLSSEWDLSQPGLANRAKATAAGTAPKAWRFAGEMDEIGRTFAESGLPDEFSAGASEIYRRMAELKGSEAPTLDEVLAALLAEKER